MLFYAHIDNREMDTYLHANGSLEFKKIEPTYTDRYRCVATNPGGTVTRSIQMNVNYYICYVIHT